MSDTRDIAVRAEEAAASINDPTTHCIAVTYWAKGYAEAMRDITEYQQRLSDKGDKNDERQEPNNSRKTHRSSAPTRMVATVEQDDRGESPTS